MLNAAKRRHRLLVSIHDVTPALEDGIHQLWTMCRDVGLTPALLVVPDWHGQWPIERHPTFLDWVRSCARDGAEIVLHGERHDEVGLPRAWRDTLRAAGRTAREGEFLTLDATAAGEHITRGLARLAAQQLTAVGFIPPAWLAREDTHDVVRALGLAFSEDATGVRVHRTPRRLHAPALRWSGRTSLRARASRVMADWRWQTLQHTPLLRLALHPQDLDHPVTAQSVGRDLVRWAHVRSAVRYDTL